MGRLKYLSHDRQRERPVYFQWQILDWDPPQEVLQELTDHKPQFQIVTPQDVSLQGTLPLLETTVPQPRQKTGVTTPQFRAIKVSDRGLLDEKNHKLGLAGEYAVIASTLSK